MRFSFSNLRDFAGQVKHSKSNWCHEGMKEARNDRAAPKVCPDSFATFASSRDT